jgi:hypothetical protein
MADRFHFSRDTKVFITFPGSTTTGWEIPVLDGFSFSQATNTSEITLNEMESAAGVSRRSRQMFTDSYAPAEWSFSTYMRPFGANPAAGTSRWEPSGDISGNPQHAVEEALWAFFTGGFSDAPSIALGASSTATAWSNTGIGASSDTEMTISWDKTEVGAMAEFDIYFVMSGASSATNRVYKISSCVVNEAAIDFDIDGIATIAWSGFGKLIEDAGTSLSITNEINEGIGDTSNFIRNRLTSLEVANAAGGNFQSSYNLVLTGGNITISNNITYLTPETIGSVNQPLGNVSGTRSISGSFTCYLNEATASSKDLFEDVIESTSVITNDFDLKFIVGGGSASSPNTPSVQFLLPNCHLEVPTHSIDDIISLETNFHALPANISPGTTTTNYEIQVKYRGADLTA